MKHLILILCTIFTAAAFADAKTEQKLQQLQQEQEKIQKLLIDLRAKEIKNNKHCKDIAAEIIQLNKELSDLLGTKPEIQKSINEWEKVQKLQDNLRAIKISNDKHLKDATREVIELNRDLSDFFKTRQEIQKNTKKREKTLADLLRAIDTLPKDVSKNIIQNLIREMNRELIQELERKQKLLIDLRAKEIKNNKHCKDIAEEIIKLNNELSDLFGTKPEIQKNTNKLILIDQEIETLKKQNK